MFVDCPLLLFVAFLFYLFFILFIFYLFILCVLFVVFCSWNNNRTTVEFFSSFIFVVFVDFCFVFVVGYRCSLLGGKRGGFKEPTRPDQFLFCGTTPGSAIVYRLHAVVVVVNIVVLSFKRRYILKTFSDFIFCIFSFLFQERLY